MPIPKLAVCEESLAIKDVGRLGPARDGDSADGDVREGRPTDRPGQIGTSEPHRDDTLPSDVVGSEGATDEPQLTSDGQTAGIPVGTEFGS